MPVARQTTRPINCRDADGAYEIPRQDGAARLAEALPPEIAVEAGHQHQLAVGVSGMYTELQQIAEKLRLVDGKHLRQHTARSWNTQASKERRCPNVTRTGDNACDFQMSSVLLVMQPKRRTSMLAYSEPSRCGRSARARTL